MQQKPAATGEDDVCLETVLQVVLSSCTPDVARAGNGDGELTRPFGRRERVVGGGLISRSLYSKARLLLSRLRGSGSVYSLLASIVSSGWIEPTTIGFRGHISTH